jgi:hypothetical protein
MTDRIDLHDMLSKWSFEHAVLCTFAFDSDFFEAYCLERFASLHDNNNVSVLVDRQEYARLLTGPASERPRQANVRYLLHPIRAPRRFHPKIFLFTSRERGLLVVGSANLTRAGITLNGELVVAYRFEAGRREQHVAPFRAAFEFLRELEQRNPSTYLQSNLNLLADEAPWLGVDDRSDEVQPRFVHNLKEPIWAQVCAGINSPVDAVYVLSPFFDPKPLLLDQVKSDLHPAKCMIYTENGRTTMTEAWFAHAWVRSGVASVRFCSIFDEQHHQQLHAKGIAIVCGDRVRLAVGSANFTQAGMLSTALDGNIETVIIFNDLPLKSCNPEKLFDPSTTAHVDALRTKPRRKEFIPPSATVQLEEASLDEDRLTCRLVLPESLTGQRPTAVLISADGASFRVPLTLGSDGTWTATLDNEFTRRCDEAAVVVQVEIAVPGARPTPSNRVFLINLQDIVTGKSTRCERRIREAQRSAVQFAAVLQDLLRANDTDALMSFLTYCDIHIAGGNRWIVAGRMRPPSEGVSGELKVLGARNLQTYASLHEAAVGFCERHLNRLSRHCTAPTLDRLPSCMHVALAVANVLGAQVERMLVGFENLEDPLDPHAWYDHRDRLDCYLNLFRSLTETVEQKYLAGLLASYEEPRVREAMAPDLEPFRAVCLRFLGVRERVEACRASRLRVRNTMGQVGAPFVHEANLISVQSWPAWSAPIYAAVSQCNKWLPGAEIHP